MLKKNQSFHGVVRSEGNNGGDFVEIEDKGNGLLHLKSGSCCVMTIDAVIPVEFLTAVFEKVMLENNMEIHSVIDSFGWDVAFKEKLKRMVRECS